MPCPPPGDLPNPGVEPESLLAPALTDRFFYHWATLETNLVKWNLNLPNQLRKHKQIKSNEEKNPAQSRMDKKRDEKRHRVEREDQERSYGQKGKEGGKINSNILS